MSTMNQNGNSGQTGHYLRRPYIRKYVLDAVKERAPKNADGDFIDPNTNEVIKGGYDLGHISGHEFNLERRKAEMEGLTQKEFNDRMNDPDLYQIESSHENRSHEHELKDPEKINDYLYWKGSCAEGAYRYQGGGSYPGHDELQNGVIAYGVPTTFYATRWDDKQLDSGFFTDQATIDACSKDGVLDSNKLGESLQTSPSGYKTDGTYKVQKPICRAYEVDWDRLDQLSTENPRVYKNLTNPDDLSPDGRGIKCAFGKAEANPQFGDGGGNQYYIDKETFRDGVRRGVFKEVPEKTLREDNGTLTRENVPRTKEYENNVENERAKVDALEKAKGPLSPDQINSVQVENEGNSYIAQPDPSYNYDDSLNHAASEYQQDEILEEDRNEMPSEEQTEEQAEEENEEESDEEVEAQTEEESEDESENQSEEQSEDQTEDESEERTEEESENQTDEDEMGTTTVEGPEEEPEEDEEQAEEENEDESENQSEEQSEDQTEDESEDRTEDESENQTDEDEMGTTAVEGPEEESEEEPEEDEEQAEDQGEDQVEDQTEDESEDRTEDESKNQTDEDEMGTTAVEESAEEPGEGEDEGEDQGESQPVTQGEESPEEQDDSEGMGTVAAGTENSDSAPSESSGPSEGSSESHNSGMGM